MNYDKRFEEKAEYGFFIKILLACTFVLLAGIFVLAQSLIPQALFQAKAVTTVALAAGMASLWLFFDMRFGADAQSVFAKTGPFAYRIRKRDITRASVVQKIPFWTGWGIRIWWWDGFTLAFVSHHKRSLFIDKKSGLFKKIVFSVSNPEQFARKAGLKLSR